MKLDFFLKILTSFPTRYTNIIGSTLPPGSHPVIDLIDPFTSPLLSIAPGNLYPDDPEPAVTDNLSVLRSGPTHHLVVTVIVL